MNKELSLTKRKDFLAIQKFGYRLYGRFVTIAFKNTNHNILGKFGITVSKKIGRAHERNLFKRRVRHILRDNKDLLAKKSIVLIAKQDVKDAPFDELSKEILKLLSSTKKTFHKGIQKI